MGGIYLIVFIYLIFKYLKLNLYNQNINLFIIILFFTTYLIPIIYSYLFVPILNPRYIFFVIVPILFLISDLLFYEKNKLVKKFILLLILFSTFLNHFTENTFKQFYSQIYPSKPTIKTALKHISNSNIHDYSFLLDENNSLNINSVYKNYLQKYSSKIDNELNFINYTENNFNKNKIWLINITDITNNKVLTMPAILSNYKILTKKEFNHVKIYLLEKN